jgi:hypothetical protein
VFTSGKDRYGREMGTVFVGDKNINEWLVENGSTWHYKKYSTDAKLAELERAREPPVWAYGRMLKHTDCTVGLSKPSKAASSRKKGGALPLGFWLNTSSNSRHNSTCRYYENTSKGRACKKDEGKACGMCGG